MNRFHTSLSACVAILSAACVCHAGVRDSAVFTSVPSTPVGAIRNLNVTAAYTAQQVVIEGTFVPNSAYDQATRARQGQEAICQIKTPGGESITVQLPTSGRKVVPLSAPVTATGNWIFRMEDTRDDAGVDGVWTSLRFTLVDGPPAGVIEVGDLGSATVSAPTLRGAIRWYRFDISSVFFGDEGFIQGFLDIDTEGSAGTILANPDIALYSADGVLVASDRSDGSGDNALLTFGVPNAGVRTVPAGSLPADGRDGLNLPAGTYFLAVGPRGATFGPFGWNAAATPLQSTGSKVIVNFRTHTHISQADFTRDGDVNNTDLNSFLNAFAQVNP